MKDWDRAFDNMDHVAGSADLPAHWAAEAAAYRDSGVSVETDIPYGDAPREKLDIVWPDGKPKGLAVFVHGGYWMRLSKSDWTQFAEGARASGWAVTIPSYTLAPKARIPEMTKEIARAIAVAGAKIKGPIRLGGHSAGGHLVTRMVCKEGPLAPALQARVTHVLSISGLHDLRPLLKTGMNKTLGLDLKEARSESPALSEPVDNIRVTAWVGGDERPEFLRQASLLEKLWDGLDADIQLVVEKANHHFSVIEGLKDSDSAICRAFVAN